MRNQEKWKQAARIGIPDAHKRKFVLNYLGIDPAEARNQYALVKSIAGEDFVNLTRGSRMIQSQSTLPDFLTSEAKGELEFMLMYINKKMQLKTCYLLANLMQLLMVFLRPAEVYAVIECLRLRTQEISNASKTDELRWHFTITQQLYNKTLASFIDSYLRTTHRKKRSVVTHCQKVGFDFTQFVDSCFRHFLTDFLPLSSLLDILLIFLVEGVKSLFRMTYAISKLHKDKIKTFKDRETFISSLGVHSKSVMPNSHSLFLKLAFKYPLGSASKVRFSQQQVTAIMS